MTDDTSVKDAPPFPIPADYVGDKEREACAAVLAEFAEHKKYPGPLDATEAAFQRLYGQTVQRIPAREHRGAGWEEYIAAWMRLNARIRTELELDDVRWQLAHSRGDA